jgi:hypothetical protein
MVRIAHVEHLGDSSQNPKHGGRPGHEAQVGQRLVIAAGSGLPDRANAGVAVGERVDRRDFGDPVEGQSAVVRPRLPSRHSPEVGSRDMGIS